MSLAGTVDRAGGATTTDLGNPGVGVDVDGVDGAHVEHDAAVTQRPAGRGVAAAPYRQRQAVLTREADRAGHVGGGRGTDDDGRRSFNGCVEQGACIRVPAIARLEGRTIDQLA